MKFMDKIRLKFAERRYKKQMKKPFRQRIRRMTIKPVNNDIYAIKMKDGRYTFIQIPMNPHTMFDYFEGLEHARRLGQKHARLAMDNIDNNKVRIDKDKFNQEKKDWLDKNKDKDPKDLI